MLESSCQGGSDTLRLTLISLVHGNMDPSSSYVLYNVLLQEVVKHPNTCDWTDPLLCDRLCDVLKSVARWSYIDFYRDRRENSFSLRGLGDAQRDALLEVMERQMDRMTGAITALSTDYSDDVMMETSDVMFDTSRNKENTNSVLVSRIYTYVRYQLLQWSMYINYITIIVSN